jgi:hypothetical protein
MHHILQLIHHILEPKRGTPVQLPVMATSWQRERPQCKTMFAEDKGRNCPGGGFVTRYFFFFFVGLAPFLI